ncbi:SDR family oxidoreductase [Lysobacter sp. BMK333-48F3]|uniref:SDR family NAD(P)-dependent oxidoreductase n=1 Tax=Lysobacter sp. BMK333-48F3 TaxID=2867962 RepID=UPI001C8C192C|nr:SDR family oxidoreductase [Lysobacter sp. BMK333-48F3]MBX9401282.1 SDR family oxidoreductase [Lysobacter sp. BMK333-48F3]
MQGELAGKVALVYGGSGAIGGAVARAFASAGARVFLAARGRERLDAAVAAIAADGGQAEADCVDVLDPEAVHRHADAVAARAGGIDAVFNAAGFVHVQGVALAELSLEQFELPVQRYLRSHYLIAQAAARHLRPGGALMTIVTPVARMTGPGYLGHCVACAGVEALWRHLAGELGPRGVRTVCLRSHAIPETLARGSHAREVFQPQADAAGLSIEAMLQGAAEGTVLKRLPGLDEIAGSAVYAASPRAAAMTGAILNLTSGFLVD